MPQATMLELSTLHHLSDSLSDDFAQQLKAAVLDCRQRPSLSTKREVNIRLVIWPDPEDPDDVLIEPITTRKTPARKIQPIKARRSRTDQLQFDFDEGDVV